MTHESPRQLCCNFGIDLRITLWLRLLIFALVLQTHPLFAANTTFTVYTVNYPLRYFAQRIASKHAKVIFPAPAGVDPAFWKPGLDTIADYQRADLVLLNGANYAKWPAKVSLPIGKLVNTSAHLKDRYIRLDDIVTHTHGPTGEHSHTGTAFTTWLDFDFAADQASAIKSALVRKLPAHDQELEKNLQSLRSELLELDRKVKEIVAKKPGKPLLASHPVYQYLAKRYSLNLTSLHWEPDTVPEPAMWSALESLLAEGHARWMVWEGPPNKESVNKLKSLGVDSIVFNPAGNNPEKGDFMSIMRKNVHHLRRAFQ
ncbi:MAG: zinc ABC transporter solute-binding protein [Deltaproteobacteria bacterium]|nr:zinc ABC transporter solute-binding protein [Deltaproteobacteria bacterium]